MSEPRRYMVAFMCEEDGRFEVVETFDERDDASANRYCEEHYGEQEWYLLDSEGENVNGGERCPTCNTWWAMSRVHRLGGQSAAARACGVSKQRLSHYLTGRVVWPVEILKRLAEAN